ncbi:MAG TPA: flavin reductase family protein [Candidatus Nanoarchaeia archaeon]|nr:flavin reductase family protein [Candidatus Nanoarchaeia archaeon]
MEYQEPGTKVQVPVGWTKYLLVTHPVEFITTIGRVNGKMMSNIAPFATCLDTSYDPPYVTFAAALRQHAVHGQPQTSARMNTYSNIRQNGMFIVNVPDRSLLPVLGIVARPYPRKDLEDKIKKAGLGKVQPLVLPKKHEVYPPLIAECLAHLECEAIDIHQPKRSDHYLVTGEVVGASYDMSLGDDVETVRVNLARRVFHHFGADSRDPAQRHIGYIQPDMVKTITFRLEEKAPGERERT